jgi:hypothetical protein
VQDWGDAAVPCAAQPAGPVAENIDARIDGAITVEEIETRLAAMKKGKAAGHDGLPVELVQQGGQVVIELLVTLFNLVWQREQVPTSWRKGVIVSIHKKGDKTVAGNYRPITLLPVLDKLYMAILAARLRKHVPLHDHQFAFREKRGTVDALFALTEPLRLRTAAGLPTYALSKTWPRPTTQYGTQGYFSSSTRKG